MKVVQHHDAREFAARCRPLLFERECENCGLIGMVGALEEGTLSDAMDPLRHILSIEHADEIRAVAVQTRPNSMVVSRLNSDMIDLLVQKLIEMRWEGEGFFGPIDGVDLLAEKWGVSTNATRQLLAGMRVFELKTVTPPLPAQGRLILAGDEHLNLLSEWRGAFGREINEPENDPRIGAKKVLSEKRFFLWEDGGDYRAMAAIAGPTPNGIRINQVYTPPEFRGHGYASNLVAALSQCMLDSGRKFCFLFTDLANPTSNKIYQQIGYRPVCDFHKWSVAHRE